MSYPIILVRALYHRKILTTWRVDVWGIYMKPYVFASPYRVRKLELSLPGTNVYQSRKKHLTEEKKISREGTYTKPQGTNMVPRMESRCQHPAPRSIHLRSICVSPEQTDVRAGYRRSSLYFELLVKSPGRKNGSGHLSKAVTIRKMPFILNPHVSERSEILGGRKKCISKAHPKSNVNQRWIAFSYKNTE